MSVRFWRSAGRFAASYKALFMHLTDMYRAINTHLPCTVSRAVASDKRVNCLIVSVHQR